MTDLIRTGYVVEAYANWSRWVARCGLCPGAEDLRQFTSHFKCRECGTVTEVIWPSEDMVKGVERLLMMRPDPSTRNWEPGETLIDLAFENGAHGILDQFKALAVNPGESLLSVEPNRIRRDLLPALKPRIRREVA